MAFVDGQSLQTKILAWIRGADGVFASFGEAALELFRFQFERNPAYRRYAEALGKAPETVMTWQQIPAVPTDAFKLPAHPLRCFPAERVARTFFTSGTTREVRGRHEFESLEFYEAAILSGWRELGLPDIGRACFISQSPADAPDSSLVHMFRTLAGRAGGPWLIRADGEFDLAPLDAAVASGEPVAVFSTALALLRLMDAAPPMLLPTGSWVFETGGYKGLSITLDPENFRGRVGEFFAIDPSRILNEYSMTELSSQFYKWPGEKVHRGPRWTRVRVVDPETGRPAEEGQAGYLEVVDLANVGSVLAIRTQDLAIATGDSEFLLLGRDPGAIPRGCSRSADDLLRNR